MHLKPHSRRRVFLLMLVMLLSAIGFTVAGPAKPAHAGAPACVNGGVYVMFARGSGEHLNDQRAHQFYWSLIGNAQAPGAMYGKVPTAWAELGNEDGDVYVDMSHPPTTYGNSAPQPDATTVYPFNEYPANGGLDAGITAIYSDSVTTGAMSSLRTSTNASWTVRRRQSSSVAIRKARTSWAGRYRARRRAG